MKKNQIIKFMSILIGLSLCINNFAAVVSDNDGSAFITKAEFDSLKNDFQSNIDKYNTSIDAIIDEAISNYLSGIKISTIEEKTPLFISTYGKKPVFHNADNYNATSADTENNVIWGSYRITFNYITLLRRQNNTNGGALGHYLWTWPEAKFKVLHKLKWDEKNEELLFESLANDAAINWKWYNFSTNYNLGTSDAVVHWALMPGNWYWNSVKTANGFGGPGRGGAYNCWKDNQTISRSYEEVAVNEQPSWSPGYWGQSVNCAAGLWSEEDNNDWETTIEHLWVSDSENAIERKIKMDSEEIQYMSANSAHPLKCSVATNYSGIHGAYSTPKFAFTNANWLDVYAPAFHGWPGNSTYNDLKSITRLKPSQVKYEVKKGLSKPIKLSLYDAPIFDAVSEDTDYLQFEVTLSNDKGYDNARLYFSKKTWANTDHKPSDSDILKLHINDSESGENYADLTKGEKVKIKIKDLKKDDILYFSLVPNSGSKAKIEVLEKCVYSYKAK